MPTTIVKITVQDFALWRAKFDELDGLRNSYGQTGHHAFQNADNLNEAFTVIHWGDMEQARAFFASDELRAAMQDAGIVGPPSITFLNEM